MFGLREDILLFISNINFIAVQWRITSNCVNQLICCSALENEVSLLVDPRVESSDPRRVNKINCVSKFSSIAGLPFHSGVSPPFYDINRLTITVVQSPTSSKN